MKKYCSSIGLTVSEEKTKITNINKDKALFLGVNIFRSQTDKIVLGRGGFSKRGNKQLRFTAPLNRILKKLTESGFIKYNESTERNIWMANEHRQILHLYNSVFRGFMNYYSFVHNRSQVISTLYYILKTSCAKLLARKYSMVTVAAVYKKFGQYLTDPNPKPVKGKTKDKEEFISFIKTDFKANINDFKVSKVNNIIPSMFAKTKSLARLDNLVCIRCDSDFRVEMHHIRAMKDLNPDISGIDRLMVRKNRKQIPLCRPCHMDYHRLKSNLPK